jgi:hypothetical protein
MTGRRRGTAGIGHHLPTTRQCTRGERHVHTFSIGTWHRQFAVVPSKWYTGAGLHLQRTM